MNASITKSEKQYQAESDARTLSDAEVIKGDPARLKAAQTAAKKMASEAQDKARAMTRIAGKSVAGMRVRSAKS